MTEISVMVVRGVVAAVERTGVSRAKFLRDLGLDRGQLRNILGRVSLDEYQRIVGAAYKASADPAFGLRMGEGLKFGTFDVLGSVLEHSASLRDAITAALRYSRYVSEANLRLEEHASTATLSFELPEYHSPVALLASEFSSVLILRMVRSFVGDDALPTRMYFGHAKPAHAAEYARYFGGRERFSHAFTGMEFPRAWLDRAPAWGESELRGYLLRRAEMLLAKVQHNVSMTERVRHWLAAQPGFSRPTLESISRDLGTSARSLRRRLQDEDVQFSALLDDSRAHEAKRALVETQQSIHETAYALGFRTPSAFSRAFKRWTGMSPREYRSDRC